MAKSITHYPDIIVVLREQHDDLNNGKVTPSHAHAVNGTISRMMYNVSCETRYFRARGEMPYIPFMHPPIPRVAKKTKKSVVKS